MKLKDIVYWNTYVIDRFKYTEDPYDPKYADTWKDWSKVLLENAGITIFDDCDGLASTVAALLYKKGATTGVARLMVGSEGPSVDHMVAMVTDDDGQDWIVGDTWSTMPVKREKCRHKLLFINDFTKDGIGWKAL